MNRNKIIIDSTINLPYASFYIKGLMDKFEKQNVQFSYLSFKGLGPLGANIRFIVRNKEKEIKVFIHTEDSYQINPKNYDWCDIYGNVNANFKEYPQQKYTKQISMTPSFAIRNFHLFETINYSIINFIKGYKDILNRKQYNKYSKQYEGSLYRNIRRHFFSYLKNYLNRIPFENYDNHYPVKENYIFFLSTLWYNDEYNKNDEGVNLRRANFIRACKNIDKLDFDGGLLGDNSSSIELFKDCSVDYGLNINDWIIKTKKSVIVFNTPAFWDCHGWKLGEYLAMGKAIISTPLVNDLPAPLVHGVHVHFIKDYSIETIKEAILYLVENKDYRKNLEVNARKYWRQYGTPQKSLELLGVI